MMKGIYPRGNSFQVKLKLPGIEKRLTGTFKTEKEAEAFILNARAAAITGKEIPSTKGAGSTHAANVKTLQDVYNDVYKLVWSNNRSDASAANGRKFLAWAGPNIPASEGFTIELINDYVMYQKGKGDGGKTVNKKLSAVNMMMQHAVDLRLIPGMLRLPRQKQTKGRLRYYTVEEQRIIIEKTRHLGYNHFADLWQFLVDTGARPNEVRLATWADFRAGRVTFVAPNTKTNRTRTVPLTKACIEVLKRRKEDAERGHLQGPFKWVTRLGTSRMWDKLRQHIAWLNSDDTVPYTFRHTCASRLAMAGNSGPMIRDWMGHESLGTTEIYMHLAPGTIDEMHSALENFVDPTFERADELEPA